MIVKIKSQPFSNLKYVSYITTLGYLFIEKLYGQFKDYYLFFIVW